MFKNILKCTTSTLLKNNTYSVSTYKNFSTLFNNGSTTINYSNLLKQYKFNLDGSLKTTTINTVSNNNEMKSIYLLKELNLNENNNNNLYKQQQNEKETLEMSSVLIKRKKMMSKHKQRKLRKRTRALKKRLGKI